MARIPSAFPECIETDRLKRRLPDLSDATAMFASYTQDAEVAKYMVWQPHETLKTTRDFIVESVAKWNAGSEFSYIVTLKADGQLIGMFDARPDGHIVDIGYVLTRSRWGQGLMVEAIRAVAAHVLGLPEIFRVQATCDVDNRPSARVLEKSGFVLEGRLARHTVHPNISAEPRDCFIYAACRPLRTTCGQERTFGPPCQFAITTS